jgi:hypothetical protein
MGTQIEGADDGTAEGPAEGTSDGASDGIMDGMSDGILDGDSEDTRTSAPLLLGLSHPIQHSVQQSHVISSQSAVNVCRNSLAGHTGTTPVKLFSCSEIEERNERLLSSAGTVPCRLLDSRATNSVKEIMDERKESSSCRILERNKTHLRS